MNASDKTQVTQSLIAPLPGGGVLQRKCSCGTHTPGGGECAECSKKKLQTKLRVGAVDDPLEHEADRVADQVMRMPLGKSPAKVQRLSHAGASFESDVPQNVHKTLSGSGRPLDASLRKEMDSRFGQDFSYVRVHQGPCAEQSARDVNAKAYTVGNNIVFGSGEYTPTSPSGRHLIAHELAHVVQQRSSPTALQRHPAIIGMDEAGPKANLFGPVVVSANTSQPSKKNELDDKAKVIIAAAKDTKQTIDKRAIKLVWDILKTYYSAADVDDVVYDAKASGLMTSPVKSGSSIKGKITVGDYFVNNVDKFARRVLQVGHELEHVKQQQAGMGGEKNKNEREFLAHRWTALEPEKAGTGRISHATRVEIIDEALENYYCMPADKRIEHKAECDELLKLRNIEEKASGNTHKDPPSTC